jgi:trans-aconitate methyltransferase
VTWVFDEKVADDFPAHARGHIPHYDEVIGQSVEICQLYGHEASIIDVGVATGETIRSLYEAGFRNLAGVDSSRHMLAKCPQGHARLICSEQLPPGDYDVVLMNWTLHFIRDKRAYLQAIWNQLRPGGTLVLSEKTSTDDYPKRLYHDFKRRQGVSEAEIRKKEAEIRSIMHINDVAWYLDTLASLGFREIYVANAYWCFTTFVAIKP